MVLFEYTGRSLSVMWWCRVRGHGAISTTVVLVLILGTVESESSAACSNTLAPSHVRVNCIILGPDSQEECYFDDVGAGHSVYQCYWSKPCEVRAGVVLEITCDPSVSDVSQLTLSYRNQSLPGHNYTHTWSKAVASMAGNYECRWKHDGSLFANRSIIVSDGVYVVPGGRYGSSYEQFCRRDIVPGYNCSVAQSPERYDPGPGTHSVYFNVLGVGLINLTLEVVWVNHYPVDLHLSWRNRTITTPPTLQMVDVDFRDVVLIGGTHNVQFYLVVTATTDSYEATMCVPLEIHGLNSALFPTEDLPSVIAVSAGEPAAFVCDAQTKFNGGYAYTVEILVRSNSSSTQTQCLHCTFSPEDLTCPSPHHLGSCREFMYENFSTGNDNLRLHHLIAYWVNPHPSHSGSEVMCALAYHGITQWVHTATLIVLPPSPAQPPPPSSLAHPQLAAMVVVVVVVVVLVVALSALGLVLCYRYKHKYKAISGSQEPDQIPLTESSPPPSGSSSPTLPAHPTITVSLLQASHLLRGQEVRDSMDSGLDINSTAGDMESLKVSKGCLLEVSRTSSQCHSLTDLTASPPDSHEVRVYVSYSDSHGEWVRDTLLPLLHSFTPITVTDHEGHMIAGSVISEERLRLVRSADKVVVVVSADYHRMEWCSYELQHAIQQSPGADGHVIPILCHDCTELPSTIATLHPIFLHDPTWRHKLKAAIRKQHHSSS